MGYPAQISGAEDDPVMSAIRAKFAQQQPATGMPTDILPQHIRAAAQAAVLSKNSNAKNTALNAQIAAMQSDPAIMQQIMETYGPDMAAQYAGGGNGNVQQPQAIQRAVPSAAETPVEEAAEGVSSSPAEEVAETGSPLPAGMPTGPAPVAPEGMDPALAAALGIGVGVPVGVGGAYAANKMMNRQSAAPQMRGAVPGDFDAQMPPPAAAAAAPMPAPAPAVPPAASKQLQAAVMGESELPPAATAMPEPPPVAPAPDVVDESGIPEHMRSNVDSRSAPTTKRTQRLMKDADAGDAHMRSIIMEGSGADTTPTGSQTAADAIATPEPEAAAPKGKRKSAKAKDATGAEGEAPKKRTKKQQQQDKFDDDFAASQRAMVDRTLGNDPKETEQKRRRKASATPNAEGGTDFVHTDAKTAKAAIAASKAKKEQSLAEKVDTVAAESAAPAEKPKKTRTKKADKPVTRTLDQSKALAKDDEHKARIQATRDEENAPKLIKKNASRLDQSTAPGTPAGPAMTLAEAKGIVSENPSDAILEKFNTEDPAEWDAIRKRAGDLIRASKAAKGTPEKKRALPPVEQYRSLPDAPDAAKGVYSGDDAVMNALRNLPVVENAKPKRKMLTPAEATARLLAKRAK